MVIEIVQLTLLAELSYPTKAEHLLNLTINDHPNYKDEFTNATNFDSYSVPSLYCRYTNIAILIIQVILNIIDQFWFWYCSKAFRSICLYKYETLNVSQRNFIFYILKTYKFPWSWRYDLLIVLATRSRQLFDLSKVTECLSILDLINSQETDNQGPARKDTEKQQEPEKDNIERNHTFSEIQTKINWCLETIIFILTGIAYFYQSNYEEYVKLNNVNNEQIKNIITDLAKASDKKLKFIISCVLAGGKILIIFYQMVIYSIGRRKIKNIISSYYDNKKNKKEQDLNIVSQENLRTFDFTSFPHRERLMLIIELYSIKGEHQKILYGIMTPMIDENKEIIHELFKQLPTKKESIPQDTLTSEISKT